jgi:Family of unknown function (DUF6489)
MKVTIDIDCTPEEARAFLGLPDVKPMQEAVMKVVQARTMQALQAMDPEQMMRTWVPAALQGVEQMQRFWTQLATGNAGGGERKPG